MGSTIEQEDERWESRGDGEPSRLLRQCLAKGADVRPFSPGDRDDIAERIEAEPRHVLAWASPAAHAWPRVRAGHASPADGSARTRPAGAWAA